MGFGILTCICDQFRRRISVPISMETFLIAGAGIAGTPVGKITNSRDPNEWKLIIIDQEAAHEDQVGFLLILSIADGYFPRLIPISIHPLPLALAEYGATWPLRPPRNKKEQKWRL
ncbi:MAG: hypothetical protein A2Z14_12245 [Chloroflexi bacterium RBG_16_48_8]|nr:MAG: hypothetical protein A2Z14_12245 [Chloroflexi bacterium RBG_16_48_8]